ncbi:L-histidine N(alpha)-methyltransferase [Ideonella sp.]|uniref:L-histidine N(alpha)-methyltransferase n=1 Tax=Ideonella sp. TaxID=1929293 RepID=UPI0035B3C3DC
MKPAPDTCAGGFAHDLQRALAERPHTISPKWFYDAEGSRLFDTICELPEYYPTRTETALLARHAPEMAEAIGPDAELVEFGAGSLQKVRLLLPALRQPAGFLPVDISADHLQHSAAALRAAHPGLSVTPVGGDFTTELQLPPARGRRVGFFPGSSIGNFEPEHARALLARWAAWLDGGLLIGVDLVKDPAVLHAAYNDRRGVTAAFNRHLLARANTELGADFVLDDWAHCAFYQPAQQRVEMHLVARRDQVVQLCGQRFSLEEGESLHTENSCKYTVAGFQRLARAAGWRPEAVWLDARRWFAVHWLVPAPPGGPG